MAKRWDRALVIGASSGIGEAIARKLAAEGVKVALVARRGEVLTRICDEINCAAGTDRAVAFVHDVRHTDAAACCFQKIATTLGGLDLVVYAAGVLPKVGPDEYPTTIDINTIATNFAGAVAWLNEAARRFSLTRSGTIVGISSVAGDRGRRGNPVYNATKAALDVYLEALRCRLTVRGVRVLTAKPGLVRTPMLEGARTPFFIPAISPERAADEILTAAAAGRRVAYIPGWWRWISLLVRAVPAPLFERLNV
jgi:decaprenylphospho-beta-D-erythro-pentofuranosid-2-ulose 2-reductase